MLKRQGVGIMDRKVIYDAWLKTTYKGQGGENTPFCEKLTLQNSIGSAIITSDTMLIIRTTILMFKERVFCHLLA